MDPDKIRELLSQHEDTLSQEIEEDRKLFSECRCPACMDKNSVKRIYAPKVVPGMDGTPQLLESPFAPEDPLPQGYAHCMGCGTDYNPHTGIILRSEESLIEPPEPMDPAFRLHVPHSDPLPE